MPFVPVPNVIQAEMVYNWNSQICETVLHYSKASPWTVVTMEEFAEQLKDTWIALIRAHTSDQLSLTSIKVTDLSTETAPTITYSTGLPSVGSLTSPSLPNNIACVFTKRTILRGRSFRGRLYFPGLTEGQVTGNIVATATVSALRTAWDTFRVMPLPVAADEALLVVVSRVSDGVERGEGVATLVNNFTSDGVVDSQRRRLPGRGG